MSKRAWVIGAMVLAIASVAASCSNHGRDGGGNGGSGGSGGGVGGNGSDMSVPLTGTISISPATVTLDLVQGMPPPMQAYTVTLHATSGDVDVTSGSTFKLGDATLGTMSGSTFIGGTSHGGSTTLVASYTPPNMTEQDAMATINVLVKGTLNGPDCGGTGQPACPMFPGSGAPPCASTVAAPHIVYPPDGVLLPPNMSVMSVMWTPFAGTKVKAYEVAFENATTDVRVVTTCAQQTMDEQTNPPTPSNGCEVQLSASQWDFIARSNQGGTPVAVSVRVTSDGTCATPADNTAAISFAEQDLNGGLFYWKSTVSANGTGGQIWAKSFGDATPEDEITGSNNLNNGCYGCHTLSRDGAQMVVNYDDDDSDDEYTDVSSTLVDVKSKTGIDQGFGPAGFQTFDPAHAFYLATNGPGNSPTNIFNLTPTANPMTATATPLTLGGLTDGQRPTMPDWSPDGKSVVFVVPQSIYPYNTDDDHVFGGSLYTATWDPAKMLLGAATALVTSAGENNYYPSYSPDGSYLVFDRVASQAGSMGCTNAMGMYGGSCANDSFSNPKARVMILPTKAGAVAVDVENLNGSPAAMPVDASNSWPRWSPFVQMYRGTPLLWVTFSSTRDYGVRVLNHKTGMFQCYPPDTTEWQDGDHGATFASTCQQPQIWMAAINLAKAELGGTDPSYPAFWLPFQDLTTHNHTAQWTQTVVTQPQPDMNMCIPAGQSCTANPAGCCAGSSCLSTGVCGTPIP